MALNVRLFLNLKSLQGYGGKTAFNGVIPLSDSLGGYYLVGNTQSLLLDGAPFRCGVDSKDIAYVTAYGTFDSANRSTPTCVSITGAGIFTHNQSLVKIEKRETPVTLWHLHIESPTVEEFNATLTALQNGELKARGVKQTVLERMQDELVIASERLREKVAVEIILRNEFVYLRKEAAIAKHIKSTWLGKLACWQDSFR